MPIHRLRDIMPKGFYVRTLLIMFVPIVALLVGMTWYYFEDHLRDVNRRLSDGVGRNIALIAMAHDRDRSLLTQSRDVVEETQTFTIELAGACPLADERARVGRGYPSVLRALETHLRGREYRLAYAGDNRDLQICVPSGGEALVFTLPRKRAVIINGHIFIVWVIAFGLALTGIAYAFLRNQVRSILRLGEAARAFGRGRELPDFKPSGATELREAASAVIDMRDRLRAAADQRTAMLAAVSHDLRTPLTRLKLQLAMIEPTEDVIAARHDLDEMAAMLDEYLAFARGEEGESAQPTRIDDLVRAAAAGVPHEPGQISLGALPEATLSVRPLAVKRALRNLVSNALAHADRVDIAMLKGPRALDILIDDDGPGIAPERREEAFRPFARLDAARNQNTAGVGLGLALARDVARGHGGDIRLEQSPLGGLRARLRLPL